MVGLIRAGDNGAGAEAGSGDDGAGTVAGSSDVGVVVDLGVELGSDCEDGRDGGSCAADGDDGAFCGRGCDDGEVNAGVDVEVGGAV